jgi:hypothetical protein
MTAKKSEARQPVPKVEVTKSPEFRSVYINNVAIQVSPLDFRFVLGEATTEDDKLRIEQKLSVVMSPQEAKLVRDILNGNVQHYERLYGEIHLPVPGPPKS